MNTRLDPMELALIVARRAEFNYQVGAVLCDRREGRPFSWGWAHRGPRYGSIHAEAHAIQRANPRRLVGSTLYVAGLKRGTSRVILTRPCAECQAYIHKKGVGQVIYTGGPFTWGQMVGYAGSEKLVDYGLEPVV